MSKNERKTVGEGYLGLFVQVSVSDTTSKKPNAAETKKQNGNQEDNN
jgi:hypothetical protein